MTLMAGPNDLSTFLVLRERKLPRIFAGHLEVEPKAEVDLENGPFCQHCTFLRLVKVSEHP